ncbi:uncharacterized mitochondrial protein AtMg00810-like [Cornus florida]|uniref:uncharacterized mitochondrial protein AtMg00810-like n=1 Tax=Cornus florida TaxID=4283 RepID=UPI00289EF3CD|nr:uncharacterized mitochondrial protein AtMg00810-like [Cornus florida]
MGRCIVLLVYVDDIIITGNDIPRIAQVKLQLTKAFDVKDLGQLRYFLGIKVARSKQGISLSQMKYVLDLLQDTGMFGCKPTSTAMDPNMKISTGSGDFLSDPSQYQRSVERLIYLTNTHPDLAFVVSVVSQFIYAPRTAYMDAVELSCFSDANYAGSKTNKRFTSGFCMKTILYAGKVRNNL